MNYSRMLFFFTVVTVLMIILDTFVLYKWKKFSIQKEFNRYTYLIPFYIAGLMLALFIYSNYFNFFVYPVPAYIKYINIITSFWYLPKILIFPFLLVVEIMKLSKRIYQKLTPRKLKRIIPRKAVQKSRRSFVHNVAWSFAGIPYLMAIKGLTQTVNDLRVFHETIFLPKLPHELDGLKIVQISDLHFGTFISQEPLNRLKNMVNSLNPDLIFVTGDFVNFRQEEMETGENMLRNLKAKYGVYGCLGNHDHYMTAADHSKLVKRIKDTGIDLLINENRVLQINGKELNIASIDNVGSRQTFGDFDKAFAGLSDKNVTIFMSHDPNNWEKEVLGKRDVDLTLAGHTHGGQIALEFMGYDLSIAKAVYKYYKGLYSKGHNYLYVNRGIGVSGPPIRLNINPEVTSITLKSSNDMI